METKAFDIARLRSRLFLDSPFYGTLALNMEPVENLNIPTLRTDGQTLEYNPEFMVTLSSAEQLGVMAHEVCHPALLHPWRRHGRDQKEWNEACDFVINILLRDAGFTLPADVLIDEQFRGMSAEQVYSKRRSQKPPAPEPQPKPDEQPEPDQKEEKGDEPGQDGDGGDEEGDGEGGTGESIMGDCPTGEFVDGPVTAEKPGDLTEADWEVIAEQAALVADRAGDLPGGTARAIKATHEPRVDWKAETQAFLANSIPSDYSWSRPNRRLISRGLYLPGEIKENVGVLVVGVDVSGSVSQEMLDAFGGELTGLMRDARPERLVVLYVDTEVRATAEFTPDDEEVTLKMVGGGGTRFQPAFDWVEENRVDPLAFIYLTDLMGPVPVEPPYPVLWVTPIYSTLPAPFGTLVQMP